MEERVESLEEHSKGSPQTPWWLGNETKQTGLEIVLPTEGTAECHSDFFPPAHSDAIAKLPSTGRNCLSVQ